MRKRTSIYLTTLLVGGLVFLVAGRQEAAAQYSDSAERSRTSEESRPAAVPQSGPNRNVGETVAVPRDRPTRPTPRAQERVSEPVNPDETFRFSTEVDLVNLSVVVQDRNGNFIPELRKEHFLILEDGKPQQRVSRYAKWPQSTSHTWRRAAAFTGTRTCLLRFRLCHSTQWSCGRRPGRWLSWQKGAGS